MHPAHLVSPLDTPCHLCNDVVREGSRRFDVLEPELVHTHLSVESNHPELM